MRFIHLRIANYRGVDNCEIDYGLVGITLVQGPNEAGKSCLMEAIDILFEYADSSSHTSVRAIKPVHRDEGPEIELTGETGIYNFMYFKRFLKKPATRLTIHTPKSENLTGRDAHNRAQEILAQTLDVNLWKALFIQQGNPLEPPNLTKQTSLSAALDKAAAGRPSDPREENIYDKVLKEYGEYFTQQGKEKREIQEKRVRPSATKTLINEIEQQIQALDDDIAKHDDLQRELVRLKTIEVEQIRRVGDYAASIKEIATLENNLKDGLLGLETASKAYQEANHDKVLRQTLVDNVANPAQGQTDLQAAASEARSALDQAEPELKEAEMVFEATEKKRTEAETLAILRRADFDYYNDKLFLSTLTERKNRIDRAREDTAQAKKVLAENKVDDSVREALENAERALLLAEALQKTGVPSVLLRSLAECDVAINGVSATLGKDEVRTLSVAEKTKLTIPKLIDIEITPGSSAEEISRKVSGARRALETGYEKAGVNNAAEAKRAFEERRKAKDQIDNQLTVERENLRDLTYEELNARLVVLEKSVPEYLDKRVHDPPISSDLEVAKSESEMADYIRRGLNAECDKTRRLLDAARLRRNALAESYRETAARYDLRTNDLEKARQTLTKARDNTSDGSLEIKLSDAAGLVSRAEMNFKSLNALLDAKDPDRIKAEARPAELSLEETQRSYREAQITLTDIKARLDLLGEDGLHEKLNAALNRLKYEEQEDSALARRITAAKLLYGTMREERDKARRAYVIPLKEKVEELGRMVFGNSFSVDIDETLNIITRTQNGITLPFEYLSGGTREQLLLIFRLACSMIVAKEGGTPVILDDILGYTDPRRLELMGNVLTQAGKECQLIILTCNPARYANVDGTTVISLE